MLLCLCTCYHLTIAESIRLIDYVGLGMYREWKKNRITKRLLSMNLEKTGLRGRPINRWKDEVLKAGRLAGGNW